MLQWISDHTVTKNKGKTDITCVIEISLWSYRDKKTRTKKKIVGVATTSIGLEVHDRGVEKPAEKRIHKINAKRNVLENVRRQVEEIKVTQPWEVCGVKTESNV